MGGKYIWAQGDFDNGSGVNVSEIRNFYPSYTLMDVTDPRDPKLLWERSYTDLELTTSVPAPIKVKDKWFLAFGSGPTAYDGTSTKNGHVFVVDLETGNPYRNGTNDWLFQTGEANAFMNSPVSLDKNLDFNVNAIYFGETYLSGSWKGKIYKVSVPAVDGVGNYDASSPNNYIDNPLNPSRPWTFSSVFNALKPITAPVALSIDSFDNAWIFVGSGRYLNTSDKTDTNTQYIFGIKDPFFNKDHTPSGLYHTNYYHNYATSLQLGVSDLFDADPYIVISGGQEVFNTSGALVGSFATILNLARLKDGWVRTLPDSGERVLNKSTLLGGIVLTPSFVPNGDVCAYGGDSYLYGLYYETGTPYKAEVFGEGSDIVTISGKEYYKILSRIDLGAGKASGVGIHVGKGGAQSLVQQSTGAIVTEAVTPAFTITSGLRSWIQK
jgi:type IV pilus assembly protein PilY1